MSNRYPFPIPFGWFQVGYPDDVPPGGVRPLYYFGRDLVLWRDEHGDAHLQDAFCPHLGAHLGHGGKVEDCQLVCPFHGWKFDVEGANCDIPYSDRTNRSATLRTYPVVERNGLILAWYHPHEEDPKWEVPVIPEFAGDTEMAPISTRDYIIAASWQEMAENSVDSAHFRYVHNTETVPEIEDYQADGYQASMRSAQRFPTPRGTVDGRIDVDNYGPGFGLTRFSGIVDTFLIGCNTPIDEETCHLRFTFTVRKLGDAETTSTVGEAFVHEVDRQVTEDIPIWENKAHLVRPALASNDGPYMKFRKWAAQFYADDLGDERTVFPPPPPDHPQPEPEGVLKGTASARLSEAPA
ncbi:MAG: Rieske 2Fe-2S domain-containing protein [Acidimicrobiia bacterium]|nr:Rieske 2Fe-2S domain-containing protein [Acidimicrobiia bacterium]